jgi:ribosome maturation factor RimP
MISENTLQNIESLANQVAERVGVRIYDIEFSGASQGRTLRIFIDKVGGVSIEDCSNLSKGLNEVLDADENIIPGGNYILEVSSPGLERVLKKSWHYEQVIGKKIWLKLSKPLETFGSQNPKMKNAKQISDILVGIESEGLKIRVEEQEISIPFSAIEKAKTVFDFNEGKQAKVPLQKKGAHKK